MATPPDRHARGRRPDILRAATDRFGRDGYEHTKWADIAADVGIGPTALYHYFGSKQHCLFVIMDDALVDMASRFHRLTSAAPDHTTALLAVLADSFDLSPHEIQRNRLLVAEQGLLAHPCRSAREEQARREARRHTRELELAWAAFLGEAMEAGAITGGHPRLTARAVLGIYNSVFAWFRPSGTVEVERMAAFFTDRILAILGVARDTSPGLELAA
jgi:TetR/AcrR family transcriptional regulator, cholesterol catabolism regulator